MHEIRQTIEAACRKSQAIRRQRAGLAAAGAVVAVLALAALCDRSWMFEGWARWGAWIGGLVVALLVARRAAGPPAPGASALAHQVEANAGEDAAVVATAIDPAVRESAGQDPLALSLLARLDERAAEALRKAPPSFRGRLRGPLAIIAIAVAGLLALMAAQGTQGLTRMLMPWQPSPYSTLVLSGPDTPIAEGQTFTLIAQVAGVPVERVTVYEQNSATPLASARPDAEGKAKLILSGVDGPTRFIARGGDGRSEPFLFEPYYLPSIERFDIAVTPPDYGAHSAETRVRPTFSALRGSHLRYRIHLKAPAVSVALERTRLPRADERISDAERASLKRGMYGVLIAADETSTEVSSGPVFRADSANPRIWETEFELPIPADFVYRLVIVGEHGDQIRNDEPWRITVLGDDPPKATIHSHNGDEVVQLGDETVRFDLGANDDVGLAAARLVFRKPGQPHSQQDIELPPDSRSWSGPELLDLIPLDLRLYEIVAVHFEAEDGNDIDGPGIGRSEVVFLEIPPLEDDGDGGGGGGGSGGLPPINPLELQMEILRATIKLPMNAPVEEQETLAHDQRQNAEYTAQMEQAVADVPISLDQFELMMQLGKLRAALSDARVAMQRAAALLANGPHDRAIPAEEAALGALLLAADLLKESAGELPQCEGKPQQAFVLRPPTGGKTSDSEIEDDGQGEEKALSDLMSEVRRQLAEQNALNQAAAQAGEPTDGGERAEAQGALAEAARSAAARARGMAAAAHRRGDPQAAAEELERAAGLQEDAADALAGGEGGAVADLGQESAEALAEALKELAAKLDADGIDHAATTPGYERLINDYLRSISYE
jgi:hypothetical protein